MNQFVYISHEKSNKNRLFFDSKQILNVFFNIFFNKKG